MSERFVEVSRTYTPAPGRSIVVDCVPAIEVTVGSETRLTFEAAVVERIQELIGVALARSDEPSLRVRYEASRRGADDVRSLPISLAPGTMQPDEDDR